MKNKIRLGTAMHISSSSRNLIVKAEKNVKLGEPVFDRKGKKIGAILDLFGPVSSPFFAVKPDLDSPEKLINEPIFSGKS